MNKIHSTEEQGPITINIIDNNKDSRAKIARILDIVDDEDNWEITEEIGHLAMIHYTKNANMDIYGHLRGILVDMEAETIIADSFGYTPVVEQNELINKNGIIEVKAENGFVYSFDLASNNTKMKRVFEGVVMRAIWHKGKMLFVSHKRINTEKSRWVSTDLFVNMYKQANGPTEEQLFDTSKPFSSTTYDFLIVDKSLLVGTRQDVDEPYIVLLETRTISVGRPADQVAPGKPTFLTSSDFKPGHVHVPGNLTLEEANYHLKYGYYNKFEVEDIRQSTGEAIIIYTVSDDGLVDNIVKIHSTSYNWRFKIRGNNPNLTYQFYCLLNTIYTKTYDATFVKHFKEQYMIFRPYNEKDILELYDINKSIITLPIDNSVDLNNLDNRLHILWLNYVLSLHSYNQQYAIGILSKFLETRNKLINWIQSVELKNRNLDNIELSKRVKEIISVARKTAKQSMSNVRSNKNGTYISLSDMIKKNIRSLIYKERGVSLFNMIKYLAQLEKESEEPTDNKLNQVPIENKTDNKINKH